MMERRDRQMPAGGTTLLRRAYAWLRWGRDRAADTEPPLRTLVDELRQWRQASERTTREWLQRVEVLEAAVERLALETTPTARSVAQMRRLIARQHSVTTQLARHAVVDQRAMAAERAVRDRLERFSRSRLPILVGPWTGEVGFELLYWIPFLQWVRDSFRIDPDRLLVVSRGGVSAWYGHVSPHYDDLFRYVAPGLFCAATADHKKQYRMRAFDRAVIRHALRARGIRRAHLLHPAVMYALYKAFWRATASVARFDAFSRFHRLPPVDPAVLAGTSLPERFVAVRFYFSECFPDTRDNREFASRVLQGLAARGDVVLLNNDLAVDDHHDFAPERGPRVHLLDTHMRPETNLAVQTAAISRASAFVGTYGGYSYLAPVYGVNSVAFYSHPRFKRHHLELAQRVFQRLGSAQLVPVDVARVGSLVDALAGVPAVTVPSV